MDPVASANLEDSALELPDAVQAASAIAVNADALVTDDRDFSRITALRVLG